MLHLCPREEKQSVIRSYVPWETQASVENILSWSLTEHELVMHAVASVLRASSPQVQARSVAPQSDLATAATKHSSYISTVRRSDEGTIVGEAYSAFWH